MFLYQKVGRGRASHIIDMDARRIWVVSPTLCPFYRQERDPVLL